MKKALFGFWLFLYTALAFAGVTSPVYGGSPYFLASLSANQGITASTLTKVQFNTIVYDSTGAYDGTTNFRFTPKVSGKYQVTCNLGVQLTTSAGSIYQFGNYLYKNGSVLASPTQTLQLYYTGAATPINDVTYSYIVTMNGTTDYLECWSFANGATPNVQANSFFMATYLGP